MRRDLTASIDLYARTIIQTGIALRDGQPVRITTEVVNSYFARLLAEEAYAAGASLVDILYTDMPLERIRLDRTRDSKCLEMIPSWSTEMFEAILAEDWAVIALRGPEDPDILEGVDAGRLGSMRSAISASRKVFLEGISANRITWNVCLWPTCSWARKVLGGVHQDWEQRIWDVLIPVLRLDRDDPAAAWREQDHELKRRAAFLNERAFRGFRFRGPGTDLITGMKPDRTWAGGSCVSKSGSHFFPNIPTEEVFSTPDRSSTNGTVMCTRPVEVLGSSIDKAWFRFSSGRVTEFGADTNAEVLGQFLEIEENARYVGEIALVGIDSPVYSSGLVFHNTLFDENAASHIALGNGYRDCITGGTAMKREELEETGCNVSLVHVDFMIGSDEVSVFGVDGSGSEEIIIRDGVFVI
jgi:aminopeptidase